MKAQKIVVKVSKPRNAVAESLRLGQFKLQIVKSKTVYSRKSRQKPSWD